MANFSDAELKILSDIIYQLYSDITSKNAWKQLLSNINRIIVSDGIGVTFHDCDTGEPADCVLQDINQNMYEQYKNAYFGKVPYRKTAIESKMYIYTPEDIIGMDAWQNSVFYNEFIVPAKKTEMMLLDVIDQKHLLLKLTFLREPKHGVFTENDKSFLRLLYPHIVQAYKKSLLFDELSKVDNILHSAFEKMHRPYIIIDSHFKLIYTSAAVKALCADHGKSIECLMDALRNPAEPIMQDLSTSGFGFQMTNITLCDIHYRLTVLRIEQTDTPPYFILAFDEMSDQLSQTVKKCAERYILSHREIEICIMIMKGLSNREIAEALYISEFTVKDHLKSIFAKMEVGSRSMVMAILFGSV
ncbi:MAG: response regulator transcription factor [Armatimonadota bacterium]